jgi:FtsP/CotA-like multicopper oxidase with cupredoxin domain
MAAPDSPSSLPGIALVAACLALVVSITAVVVTNSGDDGGGGTVEAAGATVEVTLADFSISPEPVTVGQGGSLNVTNHGGTAHNLTVTDEDLATDDLAAHASGLLDVSSLDAGMSAIFCSIAGHADAGMTGTLEVTDGDAAVAAAGGDGGEAAAAADEGSEEDWARLDQAMHDSMTAYPAETEGLGNQPLEPTEVDADGTKVFDLEVAITDWEVEPGTTVKAFSYNGQVPGPWIKVDVGERVRMRVKNELPMGTDVHWHGIDVPNEMDGVAPYTQDLIEGDGGTFTYEFTAERQSIGMYHAHHHGQMQVPNGLFGMFQIGDLPLPAGQTVSGVTLPDQIDVAYEVPMVVNDAGVIGLSLNGKSFPATAPLAMKQGEWGLVHYQNEGLQSHPMHMHGFRQLVVAKDGVPLDQPYWVDTVNVAPGERYSILFQADRVGTWVWHCHILNHVEREEGMFGMVTAVVVEE